MIDPKLSQKRNGSARKNGISIDPKLSQKSALDLALEQASKEVLRTSKILLEAEEREREAKTALEAAREATKWAALNHRAAAAELRGIERLQ